MIWSYLVTRRPRMLVNPTGPDSRRADAEPRRYDGTETRVPCGPSGVGRPSSAPHSSRNPPGAGGSSASALSTGRSAVPLIHSSTASVAGQEMQVRRLPDVGLEPGVGQRAEVGLRPLDADAAVGAVAEPVAPTRRQPQVADDGVGRLVEVVRHLERERATGRQPAGDARRSGRGGRAPTAGRAFATTTSTGASGCQLAQVGPDELEPARAPRAAPRPSIMSGGAVDAGHRARPASDRRASSVSEPGPQPRSTTRRGLGDPDPGRSARRTAGRARRRSGRTAPGPSADRGAVIERPQSRPSRR